MTELGLSNWTMFLIWLANRIGNLLYLRDIKTVNWIKIWAVGLTTDFHDEEGNVVFLRGKENIDEHIASGKYSQRLEIALSFQRKW